MAAPAWAIELEEEWVETSPSPPHQPVELPEPEPTESLLPVTVDSLRAKRGSLRALGHAAPRSLPPSRLASSNAKIVSGHGEGRVLSERSVNLPANDVLSPPSSRSSSGKHDEPVRAAGTFVVKEGVEDDRGKGLAGARNGRDMFGPTALEKMFQPPSPPKPNQPQRLDQPEEAEQHSGPSAKQVLTEEPRRASHPYAPTNPSRLSKSVTPSTASSLTMSEVPTKQEGEGDSVVKEETRIQEEEFIVPQLDFSFVYPAPSGSGSGGSGTTTIRGGSTRNKPPFEPPSEPFEGRGEPSHSTLPDRSRRQPRTRQESSTRAPSKPPLRLFRSTYDTYTREHLSALVDSIAIEPSPSPPPTSIPNAENLKEWLPPASASASSEGSDMRSSKRMRMSPSSPGRQDGQGGRGGVRNWGAQGMAMLERIRGREVSTTTSGCQSGSRSDEVESELPLRRKGVRDWGAQGRAMLERIRGREVESTTTASMSEDQSEGA